MTLFEKDLRWRSHEVNLFKSEQYDPRYLELNPKGYVPTLIHDGRAIRESTLICEYLDEVFPAPRLSPEDPADRMRMRLWSKAVDEGLFEGVVVLSFSAMFRDRMRQMSPDEREDRYRNVGDPTRRDRLKSTFEDGVESPYVFRGIAAYEIAFERMEQELDSGIGWLVGDLFSLAEIDLAPFVARLEYLTLLDLWTVDRPAIRSWWQRIKDRPSFRTAIADALSAEEIDEMQVTGARIRDRVQALRADYLSAF